MTRVVGYMAMSLSTVFILALTWAIHMYQVQGDSRWFITIFFAPVFAFVIFALGRSLIKLS